MKYLRITVILIMAMGVLCAQTFGPNLADNASFEKLDEVERPVNWSWTANPPGGTVSADAKVVLVGKQALKLELPDTAALQVRSQAIPVTAGTVYLFSVGFRSEGFGEPGKYCGVDAYMSLEWQDAAGKQVGRHIGPAFPYQPSPWDLRDNFATAPAAATQVFITCGFNNHSKAETGTNIPSALWLDGIQLRAYTAPATPEWALKPPERIVDGGWSTSRVYMPNLATLNYAGGKWSPIITEKNSTFGTVLSSPKDVGSRNLMCHSPYMMNPRPGLYRAIIRCKVADNMRKEVAGGIDIDSQFASGRADLPLLPSVFKAPNVWQDFTVDFVLRTPGYWSFRIRTEGNQPFTVDSVRTFPLQHFTDAQLLDIYPGSDGAVPPEVQVKKPYEFTTLLVAGPYYDEFRIAQALHLSHYNAKITPVWVQKVNAQAFPGFPETADGLFTKHLVIFCDVDVTGMSLRQKRLLADFVARGGGLLILGGHKTFERGGFRGSLLDELLPVTFPDGDLPPLKHLPAGGTLQMGAAHPVTELLDLSAAPKCYFLNTIIPRDGAKTILTVDKTPAVVLGAYGKGRVACVALTPLGAPAAGQTPFWQWEAWPLLLRDLCWWTGGEDDKLE